jgi:hypothetical protein
MTFTIADVAAAAYKAIVELEKNSAKAVVHRREMQALVEARGKDEGYGEGSMVHSSQIEASHARDDFLLAVEIDQDTEVRMNNLKASINVSTTALEAASMAVLDALEDWDMAILDSRNKQWVRLIEKSVALTKLWRVLDSKLITATNAASAGTLLRRATMLREEATVSKDEWNVTSATADADEIEGRKHEERFKADVEEALAKAVAAKAAESAASEDQIAKEQIEKEAKENYATAIVTHEEKVAVQHRKEDLQAVARHELDVAIENEAVAHKNHDIAKDDYDKKTAKFEAAAAAHAAAEKAHAEAKLGCELATAAFVKAQAECDQTTKWHALNVTDHTMKITRHEYAISNHTWARGMHLDAVAEHEQAVADHEEAAALHAVAQREYDATIVPCSNWTNILRERNAALANLVASCSAAEARLAVLTADLRYENGMCSNATHTQALWDARLAAATEEFDLGAANVSRLATKVDELNSELAMTQQSIISYQNTYAEQENVRKAAAKAIEDNMPPAPTKTPTKSPTGSPTEEPTPFPTGTPSVSPTEYPSGAPTLTPSAAPSVAPTESPTSLAPSGSPSVAPSSAPSVAPSTTPTGAPSVAPSAAPSGAPTVVPPSGAPTEAPTSPPTGAPTAIPPTEPPTDPPVAPPTEPPTLPPTEPPTLPPTDSPTDPEPTEPTDPTSPSSALFEELEMELGESKKQLGMSGNRRLLQADPQQTDAPTIPPTEDPTPVPTATPSNAPTVTPSNAPTTAAPTAAPTSVGPSASPSKSPSASPSATPTEAPTGSPITVGPSASPSQAPTGEPSKQPTASPTAVPSLTPTASPSVAPSIAPSNAPSVPPTEPPTGAPTMWIGSPLYEQHVQDQQDAIEQKKLALDAKEELLNKEKTEQEELMVDQVRQSIATHQKAKRLAVKTEITIGFEAAHKNATAWCEKRDVTYRAVNVDDHFLNSSISATDDETNKCEARDDMSQLQEIANETQMLRCGEKDEAFATLTDADAQRAQADSHRAERDENHKQWNVTRTDKYAKMEAARIAREAAKIAQQNALELKTHKCQLAVDNKAIMEEKCRIAAERKADMEEKLRLKQLAHNAMMAAKAEWEYRLEIWEEMKTILQEKDELHTAACAATDVATAEALEALKVRKDCEAKIPPAISKRKRSVKVHEEAIEERKASVAAAERAEAAVKVREEAELIAAETNAEEDTEHGEVFAQERQAVTDKRAHLASGFDVTEHLIRYDGQDGGGRGEPGILAEHIAQLDNVRPKLSLVESEVVAAERAKELSGARLEVTTKLLGEGKHWEQNAKEWVVKADQDRTSVLEAKQSALQATEGAISARRVAWRSAHRAGTASLAIKQAASDLTRSVHQEKQAAEAVLTEAQEMKLDAQKTLQEHAVKITEAEDLLSAAGISGDLAGVNSATEAKEAAESAHSAAQKAVAAAARNVEKVQEITKKKLAVLEDMFAMVPDENAANDEVASAESAASRTTESMVSAKNASAEVELLLAKAHDHVTMREQDLIRKEEEVLTLQKNLILAEADLVRKSRYVQPYSDSLAYWQGIWAAMEARQVDWANRVAMVKQLLDDARVAHNTANATSVASRAKADALAVALEFKSMARHTVVRKGGLVYLAQRDKLRFKWATKVWEDSVEVHEAAVVENAPWAGRIEEAHAAHNDEVVSMQQTEQLHDELVANATATVIELRKAHTERTAEQAAAQGALWALEELAKRMAQIRRVTMRRASVSENVRRSAGLAALFMRVRLWWLNRGLPVHPQHSTLFEHSAYHRLLAMWDYSGTPVPQSHIDNWSQLQELEPSKQYGQIGQLRTVMREACSLACEEVSDMQCIKRDGVESCGRGEVMRVRFGLSRTYTAESDWFVCRCNSGVMQFAASGMMTVHHKKDHAETAELQLDQVKFDVPLHGPERIPDAHVHCFREFRSWLHTKPNFAAKVDVSTAHLDPNSVDVTAASHLDSLALSKPSDQKITYDHVKDLWREQCLREPLPPAHDADTRSGFTDGSIDVLHLPAGVQLDLEPYTNVEEVDRGRLWQPVPSAPSGWTKPLWAGAPTQLLRTR